MGCDGGTIPKRDELVKTKKKPEQKDKAAEANFRWQHCAVSQAPLSQPIVACELGRIYNKDTIIEALLSKATAEETPAVISHIRSLRDVKVLKLTQNPAWTDASQHGDSYNDNNKAEWICPISHHEMNGIFRFVFLWTCGCVLSEKCQKEITSNECLNCQKAFSPSDVIILNPIDEEMEVMRSKMEIRRLKAKDHKKSKKAEATSSSGAAPASSGTTATAAGTSTSSNITLEKKDLSKNRVAAEIPKKRSGKIIDHLEVKDPKMSKISGSYSVAKDPNASSTFKSLFTSSESASTQQRAHWVTYNPFYN